MKNTFQERFWLSATGSRHGLRLHPERIARGARLPKTKMTSERIERMLSMRTNDITVPVLAREFGISESQIFRICATRRNA